MWQRSRARIFALAALIIFVSARPATTAGVKRTRAPAVGTKIKEIKAYCIDFNWEKPYGRPRLARLGAFANARVVTSASGVKPSSQDKGGLAFMSPNDICSFQRDQQDVMVRWLVTAVQWESY